MMPLENNHVICDFCEHRFPVHQKNEKADHYIIQGIRTKICDRCIEDCWNVVKVEKENRA